MPQDRSTVLFIRTSVLLKAELKEMLNDINLERKRNSQPKLTMTEMCNEILQKEIKNHAERNNSTTNSTTSDVHWSGPRQTGTASGDDRIGDGTGHIPTDDGDDSTGQ